MNVLKPFIVLAILLVATTAHAYPTGIDIIVLNPFSSKPIVGTYNNDNRHWDLYFGDCPIAEDCHYDSISVSGASPSGSSTFDEWVFETGFSNPSIHYDLLYFPFERKGAAFNFFDPNGIVIPPGETISVGRQFSYCVVGVDSGCRAPGQVSERSPIWLIFMGAALMGAGAYFRRQPAQQR